MALKKSTASGTVGLVSLSTTDRRTKHDTMLCRPVRWSVTFNCDRHTCAHTHTHTHARTYTPPPPTHTQTEYIIASVTASDCRPWWQTCLPAHEVSGYRSCMEYSTLKSSTFNSESNRNLDQGWPVFRIWFTSNILMY